MEIMASALVRGIVTFVFVVTCLLLIIVILLQKGRGGGLAGAFGGAGGHSAFGAKTGDVFTWITVALTAVFVLVAIIGNFTFVPDQPAEAPTPNLAVPGTEQGQAPMPGGDQIPVQQGSPASQPGGRAN